MWIYEASGELMEGFIGTITYETALPEQIASLEIEVSFGKRKMERAGERERQECAAAWRETMETEADADQIEALIDSQKTEINVAVFHNDVQLGCSHRDETVKYILISPEYSSRGFRTWKPAGGLLCIELQVYQLLNDHTPYHIAVRGNV